MKRLLLILMLAGGCGFGQARKTPAPAPAAAPTRWPIASLAVEGNYAYSREQVLAIAGLKVGQIASKADFDAARDRLMACGAFETVSYQFTPAGRGTEGFAGRFQITEVQQVYPVDFQRLGVSSLDLAAYLGAKDPLFSMTKLAATQPVLERHTRWIQEFLASKGIKEKITASVEPALPGDYNIVFQPSRPLPAVAAVTFEHNQLLTQEQLREAIAPTGVGAPYTEDRFRQVLNASIRPLYEKRGHMKVAFPEIRSETVKDVEGVHVFVTVDEGISYELGKVTIEGATPISAAELIKVGEFKGGDVADSDKLNEGMERIRKAVWRAGYMNAKVTSERRIDDVKKTINVALRIDAGTQYTMGKVTFTGLDLNSEAEMRRVWGLKEGKPFDPDYPDNFLKRIREQGFFDNLGQTKAETKINEKTHTADVILTFKGAPPPAPGRRGGRGGA